MNAYLIRHRTWLLALYLLLCPIAAASAETAGSPAADGGELAPSEPAEQKDAAPAKQEDAADEAGASTFLDEIVVTAEKEERNLQEVPLTVTVFSEDQLERSRVLRVEDIADTTPSVYFETYGITRPLIYVRGTGTQAFDIGSDPPSQSSSTKSTCRVSPALTANSSISNGSRCSRAPRGRSSGATPWAAP